jgi:hypothetical protein
LRSGRLPIRTGDRPLPYPDEVFDVVLCDETLIDISPEHREGWLREMLRVARDRLVLTVPSRAAVRAGTELLDLLEDHPGLKPRDPATVPPPTEVSALLDRLGAEHSVTPCHHLGSWILATVFAHLELPVAVAQRVAGLLREHAVPHETVEPCRCYVFAVPKARTAAAADGESARVAANPVTT